MSSEERVSIELNMSQFLTLEVARECKPGIEASLELLRHHEQILRSCMDRIGLSIEPSLADPLRRNGTHEDQSHGS